MRITCSPLMITDKSIPLLSRLSILLSGLCVIHCMAMPILLLTLPALSTLFPSYLESLLVVSIIPLSGMGFIPTWKKHKNYRLLQSYILGLIIIIGTHVGFHYTDIEHMVLTGHFLDGHNHAHAGINLTESSLMILGSTLLAWTTWKNNRHTHVCKNPNHAH